MPEAKRFDSIAAIGREEWNRCFSAQLEDYDYLLAVERSRIPGFTLCIYALMEGETLLAGFPAFFTDYDLATTADGAIRSILTRVKRVFPRLLTLKLACIGSFATETCPIALHPNGTPTQKCEWFRKLNDFFIADSAAHHTDLVAFKDVNAANRELFGESLSHSRFHSVPGMPTAVSLINFKTLDEYFAQLSASTRKDMRRKLKKQKDIRIETTRDIEPYIEDIYAMYLETKGRSDLQFEELTRDYFREVAKTPHGLCSLYFYRDKLIGCNLMLAGYERLLDKFFCMRTEEGQEHNLYFVSWFANLQYCLNHGLKTYQSGQAGYETKLRLGSGMEENWMYFHHRNNLVNWLLKLASPLLAFDVPECQGAEVAPLALAMAVSTGTGAENK